MTSCVSRISCFTASNPKPVRTRVLSENEGNEFVVIHQTDKTDGGLCKLKVGAQKNCARVKMMKQMFKPGSRIISFFTGIFTNGDRNERKKISDSYMNEGCVNDVNADMKSKSTGTSTGPLASSLPRSCLRKTSPKSRHKRDNGVKKVVRFCHVHVEVDENCDQSRQPELAHKDHDRDDVIKSVQDMKNDEFVLDFLRTRMTIFEDDCSIDWSSDLVELERLSSVEN